MLQAVVFMEPDLRDRYAPQTSVCLPDSDLYSGGSDRLFEFNQIVFTAAVRPAGHGYVLCRLPLSVLICVLNIDKGISPFIHRLSQSDHSDLVDVVQLRRHAFALSWVCTAEIPVFPAHIRGITVVKSSQRTSGFCIQRTVHHHGRIADRSRNNMTAQLSLSAGGIDQPVFRQFCRHQPADCRIRCRQRRGTFSQFIGSGQIHHIFGTVLQTLDLIVSAFNPCNLFKIRRPVFLVIQIKAVRIFHTRPPDFQAAVASGHLYSVRCRRFSVRLWNYGNLS